MQLSNFGEIVLSVWEDLPIHYPNVQLDEFIIMPNHVHGIIFILDDIGRDRFRNLSLQGYPNPKFHGLSEIVRGFKTWSARQINTWRDMVGTSVWQRSFYDYIIREDEDLDQIRQYILGNPLIWEEDEEHPNRK